jgi:hypothetical protein
MQGETERACSILPYASWDHRPYLLRQTASACLLLLLHSCTPRISDQQPFDQLPARLLARQKARIHRPRSALVISHQTLALAPTHPSRAAQDRLPCWRVPDILLTLVTPLLFISTTHTSPSRCSPFDPRLPRHKTLCCATRLRSP